MRYYSTRNSDTPVSLSEAIAQGLAPDGGLFVPESLPNFEIDDFAGCDTSDEFARRLLAPFFAGDALEPELAGICREAFSFPLPMVVMPGDNDLTVLELFHGPTAAFKDVGARFLAACLSRIHADTEKPLTVLVATSGDTGGAVAAAFQGRPGIDVAILYPEGQVSPRQEQQLTCWHGNVRAYRVAGPFDACQRIVKEAFLDPQLRRERLMCSANSINVGRLLPQMVYYAIASLMQKARGGRRSGFVVPTGNLGNGLACIWARASGLPVGPIVLATNANRTIPDYFADGDWRPRDSVATLASAMDVGNPSNMERLRLLYPDLHSNPQGISSVAVDDDTIRQQIVKSYGEYGIACCPHTATGIFAYEHLPELVRNERPWTVVATAHAAKFETIVEPLLNTEIEIPVALARLLELPSHATPVAASLEAFRRVL